MKKIILLTVIICITVLLSMNSLAEIDTSQYSKEIFGVDFTESTDYDPNGMVNIGLPMSVFAPQNGKDVISTGKDDDGTTYLRIPSLESGNTLLEGTYYSALNSKDISSKDFSNLDIVYKVRFRATEGCKGAHIRLGGSNYRTIVDIFINGSGNLCVRSSSNVVAESINDGEWHEMVARFVYGPDSDKFEIEVDGDGLYVTLSEMLGRTDAPVMTVLLLKEPGSDPFDVDYVRIYEKESGSVASSDNETEPPVVTDTETQNQSETDPVQTENDKSGSTSAKNDAPETGETPSTQKPEEGSSYNYLPVIICSVVAVVIIIAVIIIVLAKKKGNK